MSIYLGTEEPPVDALVLSALNTAYAALYSITCATATDEHIVSIARGTLEALADDVQRMAVSNGAAEVSHG